MKNDFNKVANVYDGLVKLVFGNKLAIAQKTWLPEIQEGSRVLVMGGGTGKILEWLFETHNELNVVYVEAAEKMLEQTQKRQFPKAQVELILGTESNIPSGSYDYIITNFFLDVFKPQKLERICQQLHSILKEGGHLICTDFRETGKFRHQLIIALMHWFFRAVSGLESSKLQDLQAQLVNTGYRLQDEKRYSGGLVFSGLYQKSITE